LQTVGRLDRHERRVAELLEEPAMYRVRRNVRPWRTRWPLKKWWPKKMDERFCRECNLPYINGPLPKEIRQFYAGNVAAILFPAGDWRRERFVVRTGRWRPGSGKFYLSEFVPDDELDDLEVVIAQVREYLDELAQSKPTRRTVRN
jgi:hypothetical protein